jgi:hypothetical protein
VGVRKSVRRRRRMDVEVVVKLNQLQRGIFLWGYETDVRIHLPVKSEEKEWWEN